MKAPLAIAKGSVAALFVDFQEEHRQDARFLAEGYDAVLGNVALLQRAARAAGAPLFHSAYAVDLGSAGPRPFHPVAPDGKSVFSDKDDPLTAICPEVGPKGDEPVFVKQEASAFAAAGLEPALRAAAVEWLLVAGVWTEACVHATVRDAVDRGFRVLLVKDACASGTAAMHRTAILNLANRLYGGAVTDTAGACRLLAGDTVAVWRVAGAVPFRYTFETASVLYDEL